MARLPSSRQVERTLLRTGFMCVSQKGSHAKFFNEQTQATVIVPMARREIPMGTFRSIVRQSGLSIDEFR